MPNRFNILQSAAVVALVACSIVVRADEDEALDLEVGAPTSTSSVAPQLPAPSSKLSLNLEAATLAARDWGGRWDSGHRLALDVVYSRSLDGPWRIRLSNRLENQEPAQVQRPQTRNHLREAVLEWRDDAERRSMEFGRLNVRHGSAYGYNPTDYFRHGATQSLVTVDPVALRRNRTGVFMARGSQQWGGAGVEFAWAPRLSRGTRHDSPLSLGLDGTNAADRALAAVQWQPSAGWSGEALMFGQSGQSPRLGMNFSGLVHDALVMYAEWSGGRMPTLMEVAAGASSTDRWQRQASAGFTYTLPGGWTLTLEGAFNSAGLRGEDWPALFAQGPASVARLVDKVQSDQELAQRQAWLVYATKRDVIVKQLDLTGFVRYNRQDRSRLAWVELRYHWPRLDLALQWNRVSGRPMSEYGAFPVKDLFQLVGYYYF